MTRLMDTCERALDWARTVDVDDDLEVVLHPDDEAVIEREAKELHLHPDALTELHGARVRFSIVATPGEPVIFQRRRLRYLKPSDRKTS